MSQRGRHYYDPILQVPSNLTDEEKKDRIEIFPVGMDTPSRAPSEIGKWASRRVDAEGRIAEQGPAAAHQDEAIRQAEMKWPGIPVYQLQYEMEDSTWEGMGPTPRLWQNPFPQPAEPLTPAVEAIKQVTAEAFREDPQAVLQEAQRLLHALTVGAPGTYVRLDDVLAVLEEYAGQFDQDSNPSAALGIRQAAAALREAF